MADASAPHRLPELPYPKDALAPYLSAESFDFHYGNHHAAYVNQLNQLLDGHEWASLPLADSCGRIWITSSVGKRRCSGSADRRRSGTQ